MTVFFKDRTIV